MTAQLEPEYQLLQDKFPHIAKALLLMRGYPESALYITRLLEDSRGGARAGFPADVLSALLSIQDAHERLVKHDAEERNPWGKGRAQIR